MTQRDDRKAREQAIWREYGDKVRAAKFAHDKAVRKALEERNEALSAVTLNLPAPVRAAG